MSKTLENFGPNVKRLREAHHLSQSDLAKAIEVQVDTISKIEQGKRGNSFPTLDWLARFFNTAPVDLLGTPEEQEIHNTTEILDCIDEYEHKIEQLIRLRHQMDDFSPRQIDHLSDQLKEIFSYFKPYTPVDEDGVPVTDKNGRVIVKQSRYRDLPTKEIKRIYKAIEKLKEFNKNNKI